MKKKVLTIICLLLLLLPVWAEVPTADNSPASAQTTEKSVNKSEQQPESSQAAKTTQNKFIYKEPISKRKIAMKFLYAMAGVAASSILLFILLSLYNKIRSNVVKTPSEDYTNTLATPNNLKDAINIFLEKTK